MAAPVVMILEIDGQVQLPIPADALLVFLDETGEESLKDKTNPVFGFGGIAVMASDYGMALDSPIRTMRMEVFEGSTHPLHAAELDANRADQMEALKAFFRKGRFWRIGRVVTDRTAFTNIETAFERAGYAILEPIRLVASRTPCTSVVLIFEETQRLRAIISKFFEPIHLQLNTPSGAVDLPIRKLFLPKSMALPGMDAADLVAHAASRLARGHSGYEQGKPRAYIPMVFEPDERRFGQYLTVNSIAWNRATSSTRHAAPRDESRR